MQLTNERKKELTLFQNSIGIKFQNIMLLNEALIHASFINEIEPTNNLNHNERLEFLGDSVLSLIINEYLYKNLEFAAESRLSQLKSFLVSQAVLSEISQKLNIGTYLLMGKGEIQTGGRTRKSSLSDALEALIGAYYLDKGLEQTKKFVLNIFKEKLNEVMSSNKSPKDYKSLLQEYSQKKYKLLPVYVLVKTEGPEHRKVFTSVVYINNVQYGEGVGNSKQESESYAAKDALERLKILK